MENPNKNKKQSWVKKSYAKPMTPEMLSIAESIFFSDYFITLSSNLTQKMGVSTNEVHNALEEAIDCVTQEDNLLQVFWVVDQNGNRLRRPTMDDFPDPPKIKISREVGDRKRGKRIHLHAFLETTHFNLLRMDKGEFRSVVEHCVEYINTQHRGFQLPNFYLDIKWVPSTRRLHRFYMRKQVHLYPPAAEGTLLPSGAYPKYKPPSETNPAIKKLTKKEKSDLAKLRS